jgi:hypothetical protein
MVDEARQWFVEVSPPSADEEGGEHAIVNPSGTHILHAQPGFSCHVPPIWGFFP